MKVRTKVPTKKAAVLPAAGNSKQQTKSYLRAESVSTLKLAIGELLLFGDKQKKEFWPLFEAMLVQSYANVPQTHRHGRDMAVGSTISHRRE